MLNPVANKSSTRWRARQRRLRRVSELAVRHGRHLGAMILTSALLSRVDAVQADDAPSLEYQVKAAFLVKFAMFVEWPATATGNDPQGPFTIGILGDDPFGSYFEKAVATQRIDKHPVRVRHAREVSELTNCAVVFISASEEKRMNELMRGLVNKPVLTVSEVADFAKQGGMINFTKLEGRVRFEINPTATARAGLKISSKLLQLATIVSPLQEAGK